MSLNNLEYLFTPNSVAVVGASEDTNKVGGRTLKFLNKFGTKRYIFPVHPKASQCQGLTSYKSLKELPVVPDLVILCIPAANSVEVLAEAGVMGVRAAIVFAGGFAEQDDHGAAMQTQLQTIARESNMAVLGPNSMGVINQDVFVGTYTTVLEDSSPSKGTIAFAGQSGAVGAYIVTLANEQGLPVSTLVSTGNEAVVDVADCVDKLADEENLEILMVYLEGTRDGIKLRRSLAKANRNHKTVIACKIGRTEEGGRAASSHTANMVGLDQLYDAMFTDESVIRCCDIEQMVNVAQLVDRGVSLPRGRIGLMSFSGGLGVLATDLCVANGLQVPFFTEETSKALKTMVPFAATQNPLDPTAQGLNDLALFESMCEVMLKDSNVDAFLINPGYSLMPDNRGPLIAQAIGRATRATQSHTVAVGLAHQEAAQILRDFHIPLYSSLREAAEALGLLANHQALRRESARALPSIMPPAADGLKTEETAPLQTLFGGGEPDEAKVKTFLRQHGLPVPDGCMVSDVTEAVEAAEQLGYPVVLKAVGSAIRHKSELGLVRLGLMDRDEVAAAYHSVLIKSGENGLDTAMGGILVERMDQDPTITELIVTCCADASFGPYLMVGTGGLLAEVLNDHVVLLPPFDRGRLRDSLQQLRSYSLLAGYRGRPPGDVEALLDLLMELVPASDALTMRELELELNPVAVHAESKGVMILDALVSGF